MPMRSTFDISTQIILLKIDGFLKGWILNITPLKCLIYLFILASVTAFESNIDNKFRCGKEFIMTPDGLCQKIL